MGKVAQEIVRAAIGSWPSVAGYLDKNHAVLRGAAAKQDSPRLTAVFGLGRKLRNPVANLRRDFNDAIGHASR